jgi:hypothetical protein
MLSEALREILSKALSQTQRRWAGRGGAMARSISSNLILF